MIKSTPDRPRPRMTDQPAPKHPAGPANGAVGGPEAWSRDELAESPHAHEGKQEKVRGMFAAIAGSYDLNNRLHSLWMDQLWRMHAVSRAKVRQGESVLDVACGTGDLTEAFAKRTEAAKIVGLDYTAEMLDIAKHKRNRRGLSAQRIRYTRGDAQDLVFDDASFDVVSIAFGIRNVQEPPKAMAEFFRVLRPGGRLVVLEFDTPSIAPVRWFNSFYAGWLMPRTATLIAGDRSGAYRYLPKSVATFASRDEMLEMIENAGFTGAAAKGLSLGIVACYSATKPPTT
ncbi:MAG: bifunctional demethylmenaquinone methyltransferase/2-methoxy-6-polyprenyl-1,4-benzoquinol methylase UbiE [Planctomycetota bacterium]